MSFKINLLFILVIFMFSVVYLCSSSSQKPFSPESSSPEPSSPALCELFADNGFSCQSLPESELTWQWRYWFLKATKECLRFQYLGCGGNANNFVTYVECINTCGLQYHIS